MSASAIGFAETPVPLPAGRRLEALLPAFQMRERGILSRPLSQATDARPDLRGAGAAPTVPPNERFGDTARSEAAARRIAEVAAASPRRRQGLRAPIEPGSVA